MWHAPQPVESKFSFPTIVLAFHVCVSKRVRTSGFPRIFRLFSFLCLAHIMSAFMLYVYVYIYSTNFTMRVAAILNLSNGL